MTELKVVLFGFTTILSVVLGIPGNILSLIYFIKEKKKISSFLYRCISASDTLLCLLMIPKIPTSLYPQKGSLFESHVLCELWNLLWKTSYKFSIFSILLLSVVRSYCLLHPLRPVRSKVIKVVAGSYLLFLVLQEVLLKVVLKFAAHYDHKYGHCLWLLYLPDKDDMTTIIHPLSRKFKLLKLLYWDVEVVVPMLVVICSCTFTLIHLGVTSQGGGDVTEQQCDVRGRALGTVSIITVYYVILNLPLCVIRLLDTAAILTEYRFTWHTAITPSAISFIYNFLDAPVFSLTAAGNPLIYFWRIRQFRAYVLGVGGWCTGHKGKDMALMRYLEMGETKSRSSAKTKSSTKTKLSSKISDAVPDARARD